MRLARTRIISFILVMSLCISLWSPIGSSVVLAEGSATENDGTGNSETPDNPGSGDSENTDGYKIVLVDSDGNAITSLENLDAGESLDLKTRLKVVKTEGEESTDVSGEGSFEYSSSKENVATVSEEGVVTAKVLSTEQSVDITVTWTKNKKAEDTGSTEESGNAGETGSAEDAGNTEGTDNTAGTGTAGNNANTDGTGNTEGTGGSSEEENTDDTETTITVTETFTITVNAAQITKVKIETDTKTLIVNDTYDLAANVNVEPTAAAKELTYKIKDGADESIVSVDESTGLVTALKEGTTEIEVASKNNPTIKDTIIIKVIDVPVSIRLNKTAHSMKATDTFQLEATVVYASGKEEIITDTSKLIFQSRDTQVATVDANGLVTGLVQSSYPVTTQVDVTYQFPYDMDGKSIVGSFSASCQITVTKIPVEAVVIENDIDTITLKINDKYTLTAHVEPSNATNRNISYKSSDKDVAKVSSSGVITATGIGEAVITAYSKDDSSVKDTFTVKVYQTTFNIAELGAKGTDTKSDKTAINKILKYATLIDEPITVVVPDGTYYIDGTLTIYSDTSLCLAENAVIKRFQRSSESHMLCSSVDEDVKGYEQCKNITITGGTWDGNTTGDHDANGIYIGHAENVIINNTTIKNMSGAHLIELVGVKNALVENVELYGYIMCTEKGYTASQADKEAIQLDYCGSVSAPKMKPYDGTPCDTVTIRNCNIYDYMAGIGTHTEGSKAITNIRIENNTFNNIANACVNLRKFQNVTIANNTAKNCTTFVYASNSKGKITGNKVTNGTSYKPMTSSGLRAKNGITISNGSSFTVEKNTFEKAKSNGICVWNGSTATIKNNKIKNNKLYGIRTQGSTITLKKNSFSKNKKGLYDTYKDAKVKSSDDIRAYYIDIKASYKYKGKAVKPTIKIKNLNKKYYKVTYKNNKKPGTATVIIKGKGKVKQTLKIKFKIKK